MFTDADARKNASQFVHYYDNSRFSPSSNNNFSRPDLNISEERIWSRTSIPDFWNRAELSIRNRPDKTVIQYVKTCMEECQKGLLNSYSCEYSIKTGIPRFIEALLKSDYPLQMKVEFNEFLVYTIQWVIDMKEKLGLYEFVYIIYRSLHENSAYYERPNPNDQYIKQNYMKDWETGQFIIYPFLQKITREKSLFLAVNMQHFGSLGGFDILIEKLKNTKTKPSIVASTINFLHNAMSYCSAPFKEEYVNKIEVIIFDYMLESPDAMQMSEVKRSMKSLLSSVFSPTHAEERFCLSLLAYGFKIFQGENLQQRITGVKLIQEAMKTPINKFNNQYFAESSQFDKWSKENNFVSYYFKVVNSHVEILRQGVHVIKLLARLKEWDNSLLDPIWDLAQGIHEHDKRIIYSVFIEVASSLPPQHRNHWLKKICNTPEKNHDVHLLNLILHFGSTTDSTLSLEFFWNIIVNPDLKVSPDIADLAVESLCSLLDTAILQQRQTYIHKCLTLIERPQILTIIQRIIDHDQKSKRKVIDSLQEKYNIVTKILLTLVEYKKNAKIQIDRKKVPISEIDETCFIVEYRETHIQNIKKR